MIFHFDDSAAMEFAGHGVAMRYILDACGCVRVHVHVCVRVALRVPFGEKYTDVGSADCR